MATWLAAPPIQLPATVENPCQRVSLEKRLGLICLYAQSTRGPLMIMVRLAAKKRMRIFQPRLNRRGRSIERVMRKRAAGSSHVAQKR